MFLGNILKYRSQLRVEIIFLFLPWLIKEICFHVYLIEVSSILTLKLNPYCPHHSLFAGNNPVNLNWLIQIFLLPPQWKTILNFICMVLITVIFAVNNFVYIN